MCATLELRGGMRALGFVSDVGVKAENRSLPRFVMTWQLRKGQERLVQNCQSAGLAVVNPAFHRVLCFFF